jgi:PKD repeat protein
MRSIPLMAATTVILAAVSACGDGGTDVGNPPVANFTPPSCTAGVACQFTDASTPANEITAWSWTFSDTPTTPDNNRNPTHTFAAAGDYTVTLTVTSPAGTNNTSNTVTVTGPANPPPTASFSIPSCGQGVDCDFTSTSSDVAPGQILTTHWDFGDAGSPNNTADGIDVTHRYATAGSYQVKLTVTDDGGATGETTQTVTVLPAAAEDCATTGTMVTCTLDIATQSRLAITMNSRDCELSGNRVSVRDPVQQTAFTNICSRPVPATPYTVIDGAGAPAVFAAGSQVRIVFNQGTADPVDPVPGTAVARVEATSLNWHITIDDGGNPNGQNEPDFNDVVLTVQATAAP